MPRKPGRPRPAALDWRPRSYWDHPDPVSAILANVKGQERRDCIRWALENGSDLFSVEDLAREDLSEEDRAAWGAFHPAFLGGEFLPAYLPGEVEIARIVLASVTQDVVSIRARNRRSGGRILYRVVDEYYAEGSKYRFAPRWSVEPLTLGEIADLIWTMDRPGNTKGGWIRDGLQWYLTYDVCPLDKDQVRWLKGFYRVESEVYPALGRVIAGRIAEVIRAAAVEKRLKRKLEDGA